MKKLIKLLLIAILVLTALVGCQKKEVVVEKEMFDVKTIAELTTLKCYYHNVAESTQTVGPEFWGLLQKDVKFWIEYTGVVSIGIDMNEVELEVGDHEIIITMPKAEILSIDLDETSYSADSLYYEWSFLNLNFISVDSIETAIQNAQKAMKETALENEAIFVTAENRAKQLLESYVDSIAKPLGYEYTITFKTK